METKLSEAYALQLEQMSDSLTDDIHTLLRNLPETSIDDLKVQLGIHNVSLGKVISINNFVDGWAMELRDQRALSGITSIRISDMRLYDKIAILKSLEHSLTLIQ